MEATEFVAKHMEDLVTRDSIRLREKCKWEDVTIEDVSDDDDTPMILKKECEQPVEDHKINNGQKMPPRSPAEDIKLNTGHWGSIT